MDQKQENKVKIPSLDELAEAGVHLGHCSNKRAPEMEPYICGLKSTIHIIDLEKTAQKLEEALNFLCQKISEGATVLFVGTKPSAKDTIKKYAEANGIPYINQHWLGGTLTNFSSILKLIENLNKMNQEKEQEKWEKYTKKERLQMDREIERLERMVGGIKNLNKKPEVIYLIDLQREKTAIKEAKRCKIPVIAMVDTNSNPNLVNWPIPANDDAIKSIELITKKISEAVKIGQQNFIKNSEKE